MKDLKIQALKFFVDTNDTLLQTKKANLSRLRCSKDFSELGIEKLEKYTVESLNEPLRVMKEEIIKIINFIPIYNEFLKNNKHIPIFDSANLIIIIEDIKRFESLKKIQSYSGLVPVYYCKEKNKTYRMKKNQHLNCEIIGNEKSKNPNVYYNERLKKIIIKIINKLIVFDDEYQDLYNIIWLEERKKDNTISKLHVTNRTKRKLAQKFLKDLYNSWTAVEERVVR